MARRYPATVLLIALVVLSGLLILIFMAKDDLIHRNKIALSYAKPYLQQKFQLLKYKRVDYEQRCKEHRQQTVLIGNYSFHCRSESIFIKPKPTREKYIQFDNIQALLDIQSYQDQIVYIRSLQELPESSITNPKIVIALNEIDEKLMRDFYGVIITEFHFDITGRQFYGVLYSSYPNNPKERNLTYLRAVVDNIEQQFSSWSYLPYSKNVLPNETTN